MLSPASHAFVLFPQSFTSIFQQRKSYRSSHLQVQVKPKVGDTGVEQLIVRAPWPFEPCVGATEGRPNIRRRQEAFSGAQCTAVVYLLKSQKAPGMPIFG